MGPGSIVKRHVFLEHIIKMLIVQNEDVIETFLPDGPHPAFRIAVGLWGTKGCADNLNSHGAKHVVELSGELRVPVMDKESEVALHFLKLPYELARLLAGPEVVGVRCDAGEMHSPRT
jgi:hypothetical protein